MRKNLYILASISIITIVVAVGFTLRSAKSNPQEIKNPQQEVENMIKVTSPAFSEGEVIPKNYTCDGENINPAISIEGVPENAKSLVLIVDDPDAPGGNFNHWIMWNIPPTTKEIEESTLPEGMVGKNSAGQAEYIGPCPPSGVHHYFFKVFALDTVLGIQGGATKKIVETAMEGHVISSGQLMGEYFK